MGYNEVNKRILELCKQKNWSEYKLSQEANIPNSSINAMFRYNHVPTFHNLKKICDAFQITLSQFFDSHIFYEKDDTKLFIQLWEDLSMPEKRLVMAYMYGLLKRPVVLQEEE